MVPPREAWFASHKSDCLYYNERSFQNSQAARATFFRRAFLPLHVLRSASGRPIRAGARRVIRPAARCARPPALVRHVARSLRPRPRRGARPADAAAYLRSYDDAPIHLEVVRDALGGTHSVPVTRLARPVRRVLLSFPHSSTRTQRGIQPRYSPVATPSAPRWPFMRLRSAVMPRFGGAEFWVGHGRPSDSPPNCIDQRSIRPLGALLAAVDRLLRPSRSVRGVLGAQIRAQTARPASHCPLSRPFGASLATIRRSSRPDPLPVRTFSRPSAALRVSLRDPRHPAPTPRSVPAGPEGAWAGMPALTPAQRNWREKIWGKRWDQLGPGGNWGAIEPPPAVEERGRPGTLARSPWGSSTVKS